MVLGRNFRVILETFFFFERILKLVTQTSEYEKNLGRVAGNIFLTCFILLNYVFWPSVRDINGSLIVKKIAHEETLPTNYKPVFLFL
jgi:hypothetical protein